MTFILREFTGKKNYWSRLVATVLKTGRKENVFEEGRHGMCSSLFNEIR